MITNIIYSIILPLIGLLAVAFILLFGIRFSKSKELPSNISRKDILLLPIRESPFWIWIIALLVFLPFVAHTIILWKPELSWITKFSDSIGIIVLFTYIIAIIILGKKGKLPIDR